ncbi:outer membrane lipoprotein-sorting protein [Cohnella luojiensis]|uniref:Outer membrane lipoprotein carrier protein LolA n=1 Tax=Cohnella luojiensis TaxID=652876 RepID=A0A4Y8LYK3_9BACL|nr:outer membrane lipoprotein-sorting protein [Cohnella luojiensis]TFE27204.1 outer membrane lipoprotein carrier protein LolA [Cohnella luojiensis]
MRRRISWITAIALISVIILTGCGSKNADSIVKDLDNVVDKMESYEGSGTMILHTGQQPLEYKVEVLYQKPDRYRISLTNAKRDITQIVLRNDEGVFVLTPQLNKSYRFQSDWPDNQGQVYLFQTLAKSIILDNSRQFTTDKDNYVFDVMAGNYQNGSFARQKIWLAQDNYAPTHVEVSDANGNKMVEVSFTSFEFDKKYDKSAFDMDKNMGVIPNSNSKPSDSSEGTASPDASAAPDASSSPDATASPDDEDTSAQPDQEGTAGEGSETPAVDVELSVIEPDADALPVGVEFLDQSELQLGDHQGVMLRYWGTYDFTIVEMISKDVEETMSKGILLDLGFTIGHLTEDETSTLTWTYEGVEYRLNSQDLPREDMIRIAQSMEQSSGK